jgi:uncharacterized protein YkwD
MQIKKLWGKRAGTAIAVVVLGIGLAACAPKPAVTTASAGPTDPFTVSMYNAVNSDRGANRLPGFSWNGNLANTASAWARQMAAANSLYHQNLSVLISSPTYASLRTMGENILVGPGSMSGPTMEAMWMGSAPHRANILNGAFNQIGIGYFRGPDGRLWGVQDFGG